MRTGTWRGEVELLCKDGRCLGEATARLVPTSDGDQTVRWRGELSAAIRPTSMPWPADEPVRLQFEDGEGFEVWLEPDVIDQGPVLLQVARVYTPERAEQVAIKALLCRARSDACAGDCPTAALVASAVG